MATYSYTAKGGVGDISVGNNNTPQTIIYEFDLAKAAAGTLGSGGTALVSADLAKILVIPAGTDLISIRATNETALTGTVTRIDIGDSAAATTFVNNYSTTTAGAITMAATSKYYDSADYITVKVTASSFASATGVIRVIMTVANGKANTPTTFVGNIT